MSFRILLVSMITLYSQVMLGAGGGGYHEWNDHLNKYEFNEPNYNDMVPITPYEDPNPVIYEYSPYLSPDTTGEYYSPSY